MTKEQTKTKVETVEPPSDCRSGSILCSLPSRPALRYYGGKWALAPWIIDQFPPHETYVEVCGGSAAVMLQKRRAKLDVFNDVHDSVVNFFRVLRDRTDELVKAIRLTPWSRTEFETARDKDADPVENARRFYVSAWMGISNYPHDPTTGMRTSTYAGQSYSLPCHNYFAAVFGDNLATVAARFVGVQIEQRDACEIVERYARNGTLLYADPPYVAETRSCKSMYHFEWDEAQHRALAAVLRDSKAMAVVSGYDSELYREIYDGWERRDKTAQTNSGSFATECLWLSPVAVASRVKMLF